jgi:SHS2 domain-containing protein
MAWRPLEHTADVGILVVAPALPVLFADAAAGLLGTVTDPATVFPRIAAELQVEAAALDLLLVEWLDELLFRMDAHRELWVEHHVEVAEREAGGWVLAARCRGERLDPTRHPLRVQVKAITYHELEVVPVAGGGWQARVLFDI